MSRERQSVQQAKSPNTIGEVSSHHIEKTEAGLKSLYIQEITTVIDLLICYY